MWKYIIIILILISLVWFFKFAKHYPAIGEIKTDNELWGVTFSTKVTKELGLEWPEVYSAILNDLKVKQIRLPIYWDEIETKEGEFNFAKYDAILNEGAKNNVKFLVAIGWRLPRWPECHTPGWLTGSATSVIQDRTLKMLKVVIQRYQSRPEIIGWQVENEPLVDWFGLCPQSDEKFLEKEITFVRSLDDSRPITLTVSGELSMWKREAKLADKLGTTIYRVAWNPWFGYWRWFLPSTFYYMKANRVEMVKSGNMMVSELQAEPWSPTGSLLNLSTKEANKSFNLQQFKANLQFAQNVEFKPNYLWGVEWWYLQKELGEASYWDLAKTLFRE